MVWAFGWSELSSGSFQSISAGVSAAAGQPVMYGVLTNGSLWEQNPANGAGLGLNAGWTQLSGVGGAPASFLSAAAAGPDQVFAIAWSQRLWQNTAQAGPVADIHWVVRVDQRRGNLRRQRRGIRGAERRLDVGVRGELGRTGHGDPAGRRRLAELFRPEDLSGPVPVELRPGGGEDD